MPRVGLNKEHLVDAAVKIANSKGLEHLTLGAVAKQLGVKPPSLYNHVSGLDELQKLMRLRALHSSASVLRKATMGKAGQDALFALANAFRAFAKENPGLYATTLRTVEDEDDEIKSAGYEVLEVFLAVLGGYGLKGDDALHAMRALRAAVGGFVELELRGGFGMDLNTDVSFERLLHLLSEGFSS